MNSTALDRFWTLWTVILWVYIFCRWVKFLEFLFGNCKPEISNTFEDTVISFGAYFSELESILLNDIFSFLWLYKNYLWADFAITVTFISEKKNFDIFITVIMSFRDPKVFDIFKRRGLCQIVNHNDSISTFIISRSDGSESLLSSSIPDLELDRSALMLDSFESSLQKSYLKSTPMVVR